MAWICSHNHSRENLAFYRHSFYWPELVYVAITGGIDLLISDLTDVYYKKGCKGVFLYHFSGCIFLLVDWHRMTTFYQMTITTTNDPLPPAQFHRDFSFGNMEANNFWKKIYRV